MRAAWSVLGLAVVLVAGCERNSADGTTRPSQTVDRVGQAAESAGRGTVEGARAVGNGIVYGAREVGQSLSGTQGNPQAEQLSQQARNQMDQHAQQAERQFDNAGRDINAPNPPVHRPRVRGGGPSGR